MSVLKMRRAATRALLAMRSRLGATREQRQLPLNPRKARSPVYGALALNIAKLPELLCKKVD
jgi:hypothetical protein